MPIVATYNVPLSRIGDLLVSAFEGGSNYWYTITETQYGKREYTIDLWAESFHVADAVLNEDGYLIIQASEYAYEVNGQAEWRLDLEACKRALQMMASAQWKGVENFTNPLRFWENFINENDDAETPVVFLQLALLGEVVYG